MVRSRYFVVMEETRMPKPRPRPARRRTKTGSRRTYQLGLTIEHYEESDLNAEAQQVAQDGRYGDYHAGKIDLAKYGLVIGEGLRCLIQAVGKIEPAHVTCQIEKNLRHTIGAHAGYTTKHHHVHDDGQNRLDDIPQRAKNGLFILDDDITPHDNAISP